MDIELAKLLALPPADRLKLAQILWDSISDNPDRDTLPLTPEQRTELEQRLDEYEAEGKPADGRPVDQVLTELRRKLWPGT